MKKLNYLKSKAKFSPSALSLAVWAMFLPLQAGAQALSLSTAPAVSNDKLPAPNVIVSVDDSGSMQWLTGSNSSTNATTYSQSRMAILKSALDATFSDEDLLPDGSIRLAWMAMNRNTTILSNTTSGAGNALRVLDKDHRDRFLKWVNPDATSHSAVANTLYASGGTPSHRMLANAGTFLSTNPDAWRTRPGDTTEPASDYLTCRRTYNIFLSDGGWNSEASYSQPADVTQRVGNKDGTTFNLPTSPTYGVVTYDATSDHTRIYRDAFGSQATYPTFADLAFHYWATDLASGLDNGLHPRIRHKGIESVGSVPVAEYWNPKNNPAEWQHMSLYTIGFGPGADWSDFASPEVGTSTWEGGDYEALIAGTVTWDNDPLNPTKSKPSGVGSTIEDMRMPELWHAALNTRGQYYPVTQADQLAPAFESILSDILLPQSSPLTSISVSASTSRYDSQQFVAGFNIVEETEGAGREWTGHVTSYNIEAGTLIADSNAVWNSETVLNAANAGAGWEDRNVFSARPVYGPGGITPIGTQGVAWAWDNLSNAQKLSLSDDPSPTFTLGSERVDYIKGDQSREGSSIANPFRQRTSLHGDVVNSKTWFMNGLDKNTPTGKRISDAGGTRSSMVFVGANDGMLHAFNAADGSEEFAYIPKGVIPKLKALTHPDYLHQYYVDGSPFTKDVNYTPGNASTYATASTYLAGFLAGGGKGYFVLDVTNSAGKELSGISGADLVKFDMTFTPGESGTPDWLGHIYSDPVTDQVNRFDAVQFARVKAGDSVKWALITGNGYNSTNEMPALVVHLLDESMPKVIYAAPVTGASSYKGNGNGLSAVRPVDKDSDGVIDYVYAGDLKGNLWKFDLTGAAWENTTAGWKRPDTPLFTTIGNQPITAAPAFARHPNGGFQLMFGTGRLLTNADRGDTSRQHVYAIHDDLVGNSINVGELRNLGTTLVAGRTYATGIEDQSEFTDGSGNIVEPKGWYFQLPVAEGGYRQLAQAFWHTGTIFEITFSLPVNDTVVGTETCTPQGASGLSGYALLDIFQGNVRRIGSDGSVVTDEVNLWFGQSGVPGTSIRDDGESIGIAPPGESSKNLSYAGFSPLVPTWRSVK